MMKLQKEQV
jgi:hypothetical protein